MITHIPRDLGGTLVRAASVHYTPIPLLSGPYRPEPVFRSVLLRCLLSSIFARQRGMRDTKCSQQTQRFLGVPTAVYNLFNLGRHLVSTRHYQFLRLGAVTSWNSVTFAYLN